MSDAVMYAPLPPGHVLRYAGFDFGPSTKTDGYTCTPVADPSGRTTAYVRHAFRFHTTLAARTPTDPLVGAARRALTRQGARFEYAGRGLEDLDVNPPTGGGVRDVQHGPKPKELAFAHYGGKNAARLDWGLEVCLPVGASARYTGPALALTFGVRFDVDEAGYTTRTLDLTLTIPATRPHPDDRTPADTADAYRELLDPPRLPGFRRTWGPWQLDPARTTLTGQVIDTEMGANIPPPGVVRCEASHELTSSVPGLTKWAGTVRAEYELTKTADLSVAALAFFALCKDRIEHTAAMLKRVPGEARHYNSIFPAALTVSEPSLYSRRKLSLSLGYTFTCPVKYLLGASGLGRPVPGSNWTAWDYALRDTAHHPRGTARLEFRPTDDRITDLLDTAPSIPGRAYVPPPAARPFGPLDGRVYRPAAVTPLFAELVQRAFPEPAADESWLYLENELWLESDSGTAGSRPIPLDVLTAADDLFGGFADLAGQAWDALGSGLPPTGYPFGGAGRGTNPYAGPEVGRRVRPKAVVYLRGRAARVKWGVEPPRLVAVNGVPAVPANRLDRGEGFGCKVTVGAAGTRVCVGTWNLRYELESMPTGRLPEPPNPLFGATPPA